MFQDERAHPIDCCDTFIKTTCEDLEHVDLLWFDLECNLDPGLPGDGRDTDTIVQQGLAFSNLYEQRWQSGQVAV